MCLDLAEGVTVARTERPTVTRSPDRSTDALATIGPYRIEILDDPERGVRVGCERHDEWTEYEPGRRSVAFFCGECNIDVELTLHDELDWRDWGERC